ncbi:hypothetical protein BpHYR1_023533, partial [Brachionus plicatilis]
RKKKVKSQKYKPILFNSFIARSNHPIIIFRCENDEEDHFIEIASFEKKLDFDVFAHVSIDSNLYVRGIL